MQFTYLTVVFGQTEGSRTFLRLFYFYCFVTCRDATTMFFVVFGDAHVICFYYKQNVSDSIFGLVRVTLHQISNILNSISASKATGLDELPARLIKDSSSVVAMW